MKQTYRDTDFLHATARVRALENNMLGQKGLTKMVDAKNAEEAFKILSESALGQGYELSSYEEGFTHSLLETYNLVEEISPLPALASIFRYKYDGHNLKVAIKSRRLEKSYQSILTPLGNVPVQQLLSELDAGSFTTLDPALAAGALAAQEQMAKTGDPQTVDILIDRAVLEAMGHAANRMDNSFLTRLVQAQVDIANIRAVVRLRRMKKDVSMARRVLAQGGRISVDALLEVYQKGYDELFALLENLPYGPYLSPSFEALREETSLTLFEKLCDNYLITLFDGTRFIPFGVEPLVAYLYGKECEVNAARIVLASKLAGVPASQITERLRETYA